MPSPPGTFISIRSAIKPLDPYFFRVAPHLAGDLLAASDDGESVHPDGIDPTDPAAMRDARYYQTVKGPVHPRRGHRAANRVSEGAVSDRPAGTHHLDPGAAGHADANGQALPAVGPVPAVLGMIATALGPTLAHVGADACARLASSRRGMSVWRMAGPTGDLAVKLATDQQPAGSTPYEPAWLIDREAAALRAVGALVGHRLLGTAAGAAWLATPWYPAPSAVEVIHRQPPTTDLETARQGQRPASWRERLLHVAAALAERVAALHQAGWVNGDLQPAHLLFARTPTFPHPATVRLIDLALAHRAPAGQTPGDRARAAADTAPGRREAVKATPHPLRNRGVPGTVHSRLAGEPLVGQVDAHD